MTETPDKPARKRTAAKASAKDAAFSAEEKAAMKQAADERRRTAKGENDEATVLAAIAAMDEHDRPIAEGLHALVKEVAPDLGCRTWYGFPAYTRAGDVLFFYQFAGKFKSRYGVVGFNDKAALDDGTMWPASYAITEWNDANAARLAELIRRAVG